MFKLDSRWLTQSQLNDKCAKHPGVKFCNYTPPFPEDHLRCSAVAYKRDRCLSCMSVEVYSYKSEISLWPKSFTYVINDSKIKEETPLEDFESKLYRKTMNRVSIHLDIFMELFNLGVKVCPFMREGSESACGRPLLEGSNYCDDCSILEGDISSKVIANYQVPDYD